MSNENNGWISVKDKLPERYEEVLVFNGFVFIAKLGKLNFYTEYGTIGYRDLYGITHWQPLPQPPKE